jgi:TIR domain-containing protein
MALARGEKLNLITRIAAALANKPFSQIELTLDTFGIPDVGDWDQWDGDDGYTLLRLRWADDETLVELHAHLYADAAVGLAPVAGGPWEEGFYKLFLSHTSANKALAKEIRDRLRTVGVDAFVAHEDIKPTKEWEEEIERGLSTCDGMLAMVTPDFIKSEFCDQEVGYAMGRGLLVIALMRGAKPYGFVSKWQGMPGDDDGEGAATRLAMRIYATLVEHEKSKAKMAAATVNRYVNSTSFESAKANTRRLFKIPRELWTDAMVNDVEKAGSENTQVAEAFWGTGRVPRAVSRHLDQLLDRKKPEQVVATSDQGSEDDIPF